MMLSAVYILFSLAIISQTSARRTLSLGRRDGTEPSFPSDPDVSPYCSWFIDLESVSSCSSLLSENFITLEQFRRWNPSISATCDNLVVHRSYCVEAFSEPAPTQHSSQSSSTSPSSTSASTPTASTFISITVTTTTRTATITTHAPSTTTKAGNGIATPSPLQPSIVDNCDEFYMVQPGEGCEAIAKAHGILLTQFLSWNSEAGSTCAGLWANAYACVSVIGVEPSFSTVVSSSAVPSTTIPGNGIATPTPIQPNMSKKCNKFYLVKGGDNCYDIGKANGVSSTEIITWNPAVGSSCGALWPNYYICISILPSWVDPAAPALPSGSFDTGIYPPRAMRRFTFRGGAGFS